MVGFAPNLAGIEDMRILFLSDNFPPESNAPSARLYEHAVRWLELGHKVTIITCAPNFPEGRLFEGYRNSWYHASIMDGLRVVRVKTYISANEGFLKRILDYLSFMVTGFFAGLFQRKPDVIVGTSPQFFCALGAWLLAAIRRKPFVFELRDLWPASITAVGAMEESFMIRVMEKLELFLYRRATTIIAVTKSFKADLVERGIDAGKIHVVRNGVDLRRYHPLPRDRELEERYGLVGKFVVGYLGTHGMAHGLEKVLEAAQLLRHDDDIAFLFVGGGAARESVERIVREKGLPNVVLVARQPKEMMPRFWSVCDVSLIPLKDNPVFSTVIPSKLFESMGMGVPVVMAVPAGEATQIVCETGAGVVIEPESPAGLAETLRRLVGDRNRMEMLRAKTRDCASSFSRERAADAMAGIFENILTSNSEKGTNVEGN